ncbi:MAG: DnaJ domain-containing protein [Sneathiella sp.]
MLAFFIIGIALLVALIIGGKSLANADPKHIIRAFRIAGAIILGSLAAFFAYTGRFQIAPPLALVALFLLRKKPLFGRNTPSSGQKSEVTTDWLHANLDHDTGEMDAEILQGVFMGERLSQLTYPQLQELSRDLEEDEQSAAILVTFLERNFAETENDQHSHSGNRSNGNSNHSQQSGMSRSEAFEILELDPTANDKDIKAAHKRLMKKFHPDHDGSAYMAAKLNRAKEVLLKS